MSKNRQFIVWCVIIAMALITLGCTVNGVNIESVEVGELIEESEKVNREDAKEARVTIKMGAGELKVSGGADDLMEADFTYNVEDWKPVVEYQIKDSEGRLTVRQPDTDKFSARGDVRYEWDLRFDDKTPLDMHVECGAGNADMDLSTLNVTKLDVKLGAGDAELDLSKNTSLTRLDVTMGAGKLTIDLTGQWEDDVEVAIQGGVGDITLRLPEDIGVKVKVTKGLGDVDNSGLYERDGAYVNKAYEDADVRLEITIQAGVGQVNLEVVE
ncbi:MAG: DUF4097 family beta strand repeat protein [Anaerolineae bacterium]|nr:DUF4097 family beta strand repeat protein [Anaerolineae bacterium]